jgi:hypothetical protein
MPNMPKNTDRPIATSNLLPVTYRHGIGRTNCRSPSHRTPAIARQTTPTRRDSLQFIASFVNLSISGSMHSNLSQCESMWFLFTLFFVSLCRQQLSATWYKSSHFHFTRFNQCTTYQTHRNHHCAAAHHCFRANRNAAIFAANLSLIDPATLCFAGCSGGVDIARTGDVGDTAPLDPDAPVTARGDNNAADDDAPPVVAPVDDAAVGGGLLESARDGDDTTDLYCANRSRYESVVDGGVVVSARNGTATLISPPLDGDVDAPPPTDATKSSASSAIANASARASSC